MIRSEGFEIKVDGLQKWIERAPPLIGSEVAVWYSTFKTP